MSMTEYLMFRYKKSVEQVIKAPQGENKEEMDKAQAMVDGAQNAVSEMVPFTSVNLAGFKLHR